MSENNNLALRGPRHSLEGVFLVQYVPGPIENDTQEHDASESHEPGQVPGCVSRRKHRAAVKLSQISQPVDKSKGDSSLLRLNIRETCARVGKGQRARGVGGTVDETQEDVSRNILEDTRCEGIKQGPACKGDHDENDSPVWHLVCDPACGYSHHQRDKE